MLIEWMEERQGAPEDAQARLLLQRVMERVLADEGIEMEVMVGVTLVEPERIREINRDFRRVDSVTDVLSFPMIDGMLADASPAALLGCVDPETGALELGDLVICPDRAAEQAQEYGHSLQRELGYLCAHGMLHLLGYDHEDEDERAVMRQKEEKALAALSLSRD
ncbi:MAG: rRNA maturation RNase YbeY [Candidatus Spyradocola sp.]|nr:rRNA maturation RNase YbeY [Candidatus Spyradocola sp.]